MSILKSISILLLLIALVVSSCIQKPEKITIENTYPWCIVAYDSLERTPEQRISLLKEFGFQKYAYDWRDRHLDDARNELELAAENDIEVISVWLWLNAKRDSLHQLGPANEQVLDIVRNLNIKTTFWVSMSGNFFKGLDHDESLNYAIEMVGTIEERVSEMGCNVALYNHSGWFGNPINEIEIIKALPEQELSMVYNFHHGRDHMGDFESLVAAMIPYLSAVNLNGMEEGGDKIMPLGSGSGEKEMIRILKNKGFDGPWGILGHVEGVDVKDILKQNLEGLKSIEEN